RAEPPDRSVSGLDETRRLEEVLEDLTLSARIVDVDRAHAHEQVLDMGVQLLLRGPGGCGRRRPSERWHGWRSEEVTAAQVERTDARRAALRKGCRSERHRGLCCAQLRNRLLRREHRPELATQPCIRLAGGRIPDALEADRGTAPDLLQPICDDVGIADVTREPVCTFATELDEEADDESDVLRELGKLVLVVFDEVRELADLLRELSQ